MRPIKILALSTVTLAALSFANPAQADSGDVSVKSFSPGTIEVESDGSTYTNPAIALVNLSAQLGVELDAGASGRVKSWKAWLKLVEEGSHSTPFEDHYDSASYSMPRPKTVNTTAHINIPYGSLAPVLEAKCNAMADQLRGDGKSNEEIFGQDRTIVLGVIGALSYEMTGLTHVVPVPDEVNMGGFDALKKLNVKCKSSINPQRTSETEPTNPTRSPHAVDKATLTVQGVSTMNGACKLNLSGVIQTKEANKQVKFRYKDDDGNQSNIKTVTTDHAKTAMFSHQYDIAGGGNKNGKIRIAMVGENSTSPWSNYNVNCSTRSSPGGLSSNDTIRRSGVGGNIPSGFDNDDGEPDNLPSIPNSPSSGSDHSVGGAKATPPSRSLPKTSR